MIGFLSGKKTYLIALAMAAYQILNWYFYGTPIDAMKILEAAGVATLRAAVTKSGPVERNDEQAP